uniref:EGF-like domain-containing protein n=1 Tax=Trichuris muris TaxID=70415 RepID=A0A5S6R2Z3_TRIMR
MRSLESAAASGAAGHCVTMQTATIRSARHKGDRNQGELSDHDVQPANDDGICKVGYFEDGDQCHSELGSPCSNPGEPCTAIVGSLCDPVKSACRCSTNWRQINLNTCYEPPAEKSQLKYVPALAKGAYVNELNEGHKAGDAKVVSDLDVKSIFRQWLRRMSRLFTQRSAVGSKCSVNTLCVVKYSKCSELGICECQYGFYQRNGKCLPGLRNKCILIGQPCYNIPNSLCSKSYICSCKPGYIQANDHCEPANSLQSRQKPQRSITPVNLVLCKSNCPIEHASCVKGSCHCLPGYKAVDDKCTPDSVGNFSNCAYDWDCQRMNAQCVDKQCQCTPGYILIIDQCLPTVGSICSDALRCGVPYSYCGADLRCRCYEGHVAENGECVEIQTRQVEHHYQPAVALA